MFLISDVRAKNFSVMPSYISWIMILVLIWIFLVVVVADNLHLPSSSSSILPLPYPDQSLETIVNEKRIWVEKTKYLEKLMNGGATRCLITRPNGFGKSIFLQMVKKFFLGEKEFFRNTTIYKHGNKENYELKKIPNDQIEKKWVKYPVIYFNFDNIIRNFSRIEELRNNLKTEIQTIREFYNVKNDQTWDRVRHLIDDLHFKFNESVVVLVDNYDSPTNYAMHVRKNKTLLEKVNDELGDFFQTLKNSQEIRFVLVTGVLRLNLNGYNGGMDVFTDYTYDDLFDEAIGFTEEEMITNLHPHLERLSRSRNESTKHLVKELSKWYGNHRFSSRDKLNKVIHPVSAIKCLEEGSFRPDHLCTNRPILYIVQKFYQYHLTLNVFENHGISYSDMMEITDRKPNLENKISFEHHFSIFMLLHGFLTIERPWHYNDDWITLTYPNFGVKEALRGRLEAYVPSKKVFIEDLPGWTEKLGMSVQAEDILTIVKLISDYGFFRFSHSTDHDADKADVTGRLMRFFQSSKIPCQLSDTFSTNKTEWHVDIQTSSSPTSYTFRVIYGQKILQAFSKLIKDSTAKRKINKISNDMNLIGLRFKNSKKKSSQFSLHDWISLSYKDGKIRCDKLYASSPSLKGEAQSKYCN